MKRRGRWSHVLTAAVVWGLLTIPHLAGAQDSAEFYFSKGVVAYSEGKYDEALGFFQNAAQRDPKDAATQHYLGMTLMQQGKYEPAIASLEQARSLDPTIRELAYDLGVTYFRAKEYAKALGAFTEAQQAQPDRAMAYFYQGYIQYILEAYEQAIAPLNKAQELDPSLTQSCQFYRAMSLMKAKQYDEAGTEFQATIDTDPKTELADAAQKLQSRLAAMKKAEKRWSLTPSISCQYDDNVTLEPDALPTATAVSNQEDYRTVFHLIGEYNFFKNQDWSLDGRYTFYESVHASLHDYDLIQNAVNISATRKWMLGNIPTRLGFDVDFTHDLLDARPYLEAVHFRSTWGWDLPKSNFIQWQYRLQKKNFRYSVVNSSFTDRDGMNNLVGFNHFWFHCNDTRYFRWGFFFDHDSTRGADWDYDGYHLLAGYFTPVWKEIKLTLDGEYYYLDYKNIDSSFTRERSDREFTWAVGFNRDFCSQWNLAFQYLGREHNSNIQFYEYDRNVYMLTLTAYF